MTGEPALPICSSSIQNSATQNTSSHNELEKVTTVLTKSHHQQIASFARERFRSPGIETQFTLLADIFTDNTTNYELVSK